VALSLLSLSGEGCFDALLTGLHSLVVGGELHPQARLKKYHWQFFLLQDVSGTLFQRLQRNLNGALTLMTSTSIPMISYSHCRGATRHLRVSAVTESAGAAALGAVCNKYGMLA
jgi:hypothetical protein